MDRNSRVRDDENRNQADQTDERAHADEGVIDRHERPVTPPPTANDDDDDRMSQR